MKQNRHTVTTDQRIVIVNMAYRFVPFSITLSDLECQSPTASLLKCNSSDVYATFRTVSTDTARQAVSRSATAEHLVVQISCF